MELPPWLCGLWALLLCVASCGNTAPTETQPPVTNLSVSVENLCTVIWTWNPPEGASPNCSLWYFSHFGNKQDKQIAPETHRSKEVPLNEKICLQVGSQCSANESDNPSTLVEKCISPPEGDPESAVTELQCVWHNLSYMKCTWLPGRNTSPDTNYTLYYWHSSLGKILQCENIYREGQHSTCSFTLTKLKDPSVDQYSVQVMVKDDAGKIRPSFNIVPLTSHVQPDPPHIKNISFQNGVLYVLGKNPQNFARTCLSYQVEVNNSQTEAHFIFSDEKLMCDNSEIEGNLEGTICFRVPGVPPDTVNTVRMRVKTNTFCYEDNQLWSNWSPAMTIGKKTDATLYTTMLLIIPIIVAGAIIVLLLYLKRLKIIIFPPIPDPGKIFKEMFGDQNDDTLHWKKYDIYEKQTKEETDSVVLIENLKRTSQ
ncbi:interleukin 13 receptor subunit alpha 1 [Phyllostomus discolor]|uniref:Interleukin-13 receptor subunit alpha-1 n=1 Tax=Phyllostomus discolor TaxID=89673 RepID=A0A6J2MKF3_9CHIR|nr:interleukin-13 receptor subunit alpha-1 [Phyllostomus discolor]KAF6090649.1 interleukin 13 receptor subunit alpha 1 [Phyllostomus discolor]